MSKGQQTFDREKISFNIAKLKKGGCVFEIVIDPDLAISFKKGTDIDIREILKSENIFSDAKKGNLAPEEDIKNILETDDNLEAARMIIQKGEIQLTAEYRESLRTAKLNKIISIIHRNGIDPKTSLPHPATRIENAIKEAKVHIDDMARAEDQVQEVLKNIRTVLPIKFEIQEIGIKIPAEYTGKAYSIVKSSCDIMRDEWLKDGSWVCEVSIPAGLREDLFDKLNNLTHGSVESKILRTR